MSCNDLISTTVEYNSIDTNLISCASDLPFYRGANMKMEIVNNATNIYGNLRLKDFSAQQAVVHTNIGITMGVYDALLGNPYIQLNSQAIGDNNIYFTDVSGSLGFIKYNHTSDIADSYMLFAVNTLPRMYLYQTNANFTDLDLLTTGDISAGNVTVSGTVDALTVDCSNVIATDVSCATLSNATLTSTCDATENIYPFLKQMKK
jgi:hypothetical protein